MKMLPSIYLVYLKPSILRKFLFVFINKKKCTDYYLIHLCLFFIFSEPREELSIVNGLHVCQKSINLEFELMKLQDKLRKVQENCTAKSTEIKRLKNLLNYYQKRANSKKDIINNLKQQKLISNKAEEVLNVRFI